MSRKVWLRLVAIAIGAIFLTVMSTSSFAQNDAAAEETTTEDAAAAEVAPEEIMVEESALTADDVQFNLDQTWVLIAGFLVFFMQAGFAMLEGGFIGAKGAVNSMAENFMDAAITGIVFFLVGYGIAFASPDGGAFFSMPDLALGQTEEGGFRAGEETGTHEQKQHDETGAKLLVNLGNHC